MTNQKKHGGKWQHVHYPLAQLQKKNVVSHYQRKKTKHQLHIGYG